MSVWFVLPGGAAKCVVQLGMARWLAEQGIEPEGCSGTSGGALNGAVIGMNRRLMDGVEEGKSLWFGLRGTKDIMKRHFPFGRLHWLWRQGEKSGLYNSKPLRELIESSFDAFRLCRKLRIGAASYAGKYHVFSETTPHSALVKGLQASAAFPTFMEPVQWDNMLWSDAGLVEVVPGMQAVQAGATKLYILDTSPNDTPPQDWDMNWASMKGPESMQRHIDMMSLEVRRNDLTACAASGVECVHITPNEPLLDDSLDFDPEKIRTNFELGYQLAKEKLG